MGDQAIAHGVPPGPGDALTEEPIQGLGNAIPRLMRLFRVFGVIVR